MLVSLDRNSCPDSKAKPIRSFVEWPGWSAAAADFRGKKGEIVWKYQRKRHKNLTFFGWKAGRGWR